MMYKSNKKKVVAVLLLSLLIVGSCFQHAAKEAEASYAGKVVSDCYRCKIVLHNYPHHIIYFTGYGDLETGKVYDGQFTGYNCHYPVTFEYGKTWTVQTSHAGYAYGNYTMKTSVIATEKFSLFTFKAISATKSASFVKQ